MGEIRIRRGRTVRCAHGSNWPKGAPRNLQAEEMIVSRILLYVSTSKRRIPKDRLYSKLMCLMDENNEIVRQQLAQNFVDHRNFRLAAERVTELALNHGERGFDVGTLVVMLEKLATPELEVVVHVRPHPAAAALGFRSETDKRHDAHAAEEVDVALAGITFVG